MSDSDTPSAEIEIAAEAAISSLLPSKSKHLYEVAYKKFDEWCMEQKVKLVTEKVLLAYFSQKMKNQKASTTWTHYSMLRATLNMKKNIDIGKFTNLVAFLKRKSQGYRAKKSKIFTKEQINTFLREADEERYLVMKVALIVGVFGACRRDELIKMNISDIEDIGGCIKIVVPDTKTNIQRQFVITEGTLAGVNMLEIIRKYVNMRPKTINRFFVGYRKGKCISQPVGINTMGGFPREIAKFLGLSNIEQYTGHCFRRSSASLLADAGADTSVLKRHGGWKSNSVAESYVENSLQNKKEIAGKIFGNSTVSEQTTSRTEEFVENDVPIVSTVITTPTIDKLYNSSSSLNSSLIPLQLNNLKKCTINIYNK